MESVWLYIGHSLIQPCDYDDCWYFAHSPGINRTGTIAIEFGVTSRMTGFINVSRQIQTVLDRRRRKLWTLSDGDMGHAVMEMVVSDSIK